MLQHNHLPLRQKPKSPSRQILLRQPCKINMQQLIIFIFLIFSLNSDAQTYKHEIQVGLLSAYFFDSNPVLISKPNRKYTLPFIRLSYKLNFENQFSILTSFSNHDYHYVQRRNTPNLEPKTLTSRDFSDLRFGVSYEFFFS